MSPPGLWQGALMRLVTHSLQSGRGRCPYSPRQPFTALLVGKGWGSWELGLLGDAACGGLHPQLLHVPPADPADGELYSGTSSDFMGSSAAFFRTWVRGAEQSYIRTEQNQDHWLHGTRGAVLGTGPCSHLLPRGMGMPARGASTPSLPEPAFVGAFAIPDTYNPHDDKVYVFFRETALEAGQWDRRHIHARVARVCKVSGLRLGSHRASFAPLPDTRGALPCEKPLSLC